MVDSKTTIRKDGKYVDMEEDEISSGKSPEIRKAQFHQGVVSRARHRYVDSILTPESDVERTVGHSFLEMMSESEALARISRDIFDEPDGEELKVSEYDGSDPSEFDGIPIPGPESLSKGRVRELRSKIKDLRRRWQQLDFSSVEAQDVISEIDLDSVIEAEKRGASRDMESVEISREEIENTLSWQLSSGIFEEYSRQIYKHELRDFTITFYILYQTIVEEETIQCLNSEVISGEYKGTNGTISFLEELSQPVREELLERTESIDPHIVSMMVENRRLRNNLVHSLQGGEENADIERAAEEVDRCRDVLAKFDEGNSFSWRE